MADALTVWAGQTKDALTVANNLLDRLGPMQRLYEANNLEKVLAEIKDGEIVPGTNMTKERVNELIAMFEAFSTWISTPLEATGQPPILTVGKVD